VSTLDWLVPLLVCPVCRGPLSFEPDEDANGLLVHRTASCAERYAVIDGIPRLLRDPRRKQLIAAHPSWFERDERRRALAEEWGGPASAAPSVVSSFDDEWRRFSLVGGDELEQMFRQYFDLIDADAFRSTAVVLDAGCGAGRWAYEVARRGPRVVAVDLGFSVEVAARNTAALGRVACVQADLLDLPLVPEIDWAYSLGVIHHVDRPLDTLRRVVSTTKAGAKTLLYVYYALDQRGPLFRALFGAVDFARRVTSRAPRPLTRLFSDLVALGVYWPLARLSLALERAGSAKAAAAVPLSWYAHRSFRVMRNDSLDRFGTTLERRYTRAETIELLRSAGLDAPVISSEPPYWHGVGVRPMRERS
jgi:uncharacterized protein YbaR (Trm112 family)